MALRMVSERIESMGDITLCVLHWRFDIGAPEIQNLMGLGVMLLRDDDGKNYDGNDNGKSYGGGGE